MDSTIFFCQTPSTVHSLCVRHHCRKGVWEVTIPLMAESATIIPVEVPGASYEVTIRPGLLEQVAAQLAKLTQARRVGVVTDTHVAPIYLKPLAQALEAAGIETVEAVIPAGENHKTLPDLLPVYDRFLGARFDRSTPILTLGGGVVGDMGGFVAATLLRGVPFVQIPTTLLAMVDASVGGKTGVDHPAGKNLIGAFHQPIAVWCDPQTLRTLPAREFRGGLAECIKHDLIRDADGFAQLEEKISGEASAWSETALTDLVAHSVRIKAQVVAGDPFEHGERAHLNFGHTFGHAIEAVSHYEYSHGESVALGMVAAAELSRQLGLLVHSDVERITRTIAGAGLPTNGLTLPDEALLDAMRSDKKTSGGRLRFVVLDRIGHATIRADVQPRQVIAAMESLRP